jgi:hypothetical protein
MMCASGSTPDPVENRPNIGEIGRIAGEAPDVLRTIPQGWTARRPGAAASSQPDDAFSRPYFSIR